uniref:Uncharacterized protein n=1 Tax=Anser brachyrhynchus TaxID=132585 RepID=A0A8B9CUT7_9AVES
MPHAPSMSLTGAVPEVLAGLAGVGLMEVVGLLCTFLSQGRSHKGASLCRISSQIDAVAPVPDPLCPLGTHASNTTTETTTTETTTTETTTTETTTTETTTETTVMTPALNNMTSQNTSADSTAVPVSIIPMFPHSNISANDSNGVPPSKSSSAANGSSVVPTSPVAGGTVIPTSNTNATANSSAEVVPTKTASVTSQGSTAHGKTPTAVLGSSGGPNPSKAAALPPTVVQLLLRVPLSFRILNRNFSQSLLDPTSKEYRSLSRWDECLCQCAGLGPRGGGLFPFWPLPGGLAGLCPVVRTRLCCSSGGVEVTAPVAQPQVPDWAIALLVLVCILLLLSILICALLVSPHPHPHRPSAVEPVSPSTLPLGPWPRPTHGAPLSPQTTCSCRRKSRGKLDLFSTKDSYHPMAEYPPYQSHGRYVSPNSKHNPYSTIAGGGTFTYTNPSASSDNL